MSKVSIAFTIISPLAGAIVAILAQLLEWSTGTIYAVTFSGAAVLVITWGILESRNLPRKH